jgi:hypothetical protein
MLKPLDIFKCSLLSLILTLGTGVALAKKSVRFLTAAELQASLLSSDENVRLSGRNYIMGVLDTLMLTKDAPICFADQTEINVLVDTVQTQLLQRPDLLKYNAASVVREVMVANYPCV